MNLSPKKHSAGTLLIPLLLILFTVFTLLLSAMGSSVYQKGIASLNDNYTSRTAIAYVTEKFRQYNTEGSISLSEVEDLPAITLKEQIDEECYLTYIYYYDGFLRELFVRSDSTPLAAMGSKIVELEDFSIAGSETANGSSLYTLKAVGSTGEQLSIRLCPL